MAKKSSLTQMKYDKENMEKITIKLHKVKDADIINAIDKENKQGSIKKLIRNGINNEN